jgi:hypothetical protein
MLAQKLKNLRSADPDAERGANIQPMEGLRVNNLQYSVHLWSAAKAAKVSTKWSLGRGKLSDIESALWNSDIR